MLGLSLAETAVILAVTLVVVGPKELPAVIRGVARAMAHVRELAAEFRHGLDELAEEAQMKEMRDDISNSMPTIIDLEGKPQKTYDISEEMQEYDQRRTRTQQKGEDDGNTG